MIACFHIIRQGSTTGKSEVVVIARLRPALGSKGKAGKYSRSHRTKVLAGCSIVPLLYFCLEAFPRCCPLHTHDFDSPREEKGPCLS